MRTNSETKPHKYRCEIYFKSNDITTLRWLTEIKLFLNPYDDLIDITLHPNHTNYIILENKKIEFQDLDKSVHETLGLITDESYV